MKSEWFSGYYSVSNTRNLHYLFIKSLDKPETDPVVLFMMGGPGSSSILYAFTDVGPLITIDETLALEEFDFTWCKRANVIFLDNPAGVGYSYAEKERDLI